MFLIFKKKDKRGFTLVEIIVVLAVILIITGVVLVNHRHSDRVFGLERDVGRMAQEVRASLEETMAMRYREIGGCTGVVSYGVRFQVNQTSYRRMVYIIDHNGIISPNCSMMIGDEINLKQGSISEVRVFPDNLSITEPLDIIFVPPHPRTYIGGIDVIGEGVNRRWVSRQTRAEIRVRLEGTNETRGVRINSAGLIEIFR